MARGAGPVHPADVFWGALLRGHVRSMDAAEVDRALAEEREMMAEAAEACASVAATPRDHGPSMDDAEVERALGEEHELLAQAFHAALGPEEAEANQWVYLVTIALTLPDTVEGAPTPLRSPQNATREEVRDAVLDAVAHPAAPLRGCAGRPRERPLKVKKGLVALELPGPHFHIALRLSERTRWLALKRALRLRSGFASHWSASHTQTWSVFRYLTHVSEHKAKVDQEPLSFTDDGSVLNLHEESQEPFIAQNVKRKREKAEAASADQTVRFTKLDFTALVLDRGLTTKEQVMPDFSPNVGGEPESEINRKKCQIRSQIVCENQPPASARRDRQTYFQVWRENLRAR